MTLDAIDPRYRRFVVAVEPPLTDQQRRDIANSLKKPSTKAKFDKLTGPLTESDRQRIRARNRARKIARRVANARPVLPADRPRADGKHEAVVGDRRNES